MNRSHVKLAVGTAAGLVAVIMAGAVLDSVKTQPAPVQTRAPVVQTAVQPAPPAEPAAAQYSDLIVRTNNPAAANSCSTIMLTVTGVRGLPVNLVTKAADAATRFQKMYTNSVQQLFFDNDTAGYQAAMRAGAVTSQRINALPANQRDAALLSAADQCLSVL